MTTAELYYSQNWRENYNRLTFINGTRHNKLRWLTIITDNIMAPQKYFGRHLVQHNINGQSTTILPIHDGKKATVIYLALVGFEICLGSCGFQNNVIKITLTTAVHKTPKLRKISWNTRNILRATCNQTHWLAQIETDKWSETQYSQASPTTHLDLRQNNFITKKVGVDQYLTQTQNIYNNI